MVKSKVDSADKTIAKVNTPIPTVIPNIDEAVLNTVRPTIDAILKKQNLSVDDLFKCAKDGLLAERVVRDKWGDEVDREPDHAIRHRFFESLANMLQYLKPTSVNVQVVQVSAEERELIDSYKRQ